MSREIPAGYAEVRPGVFERRKLQDAFKPQCGEAVEREIPLHNKIIKWLDSQSPRWKYIRARPDMKSTIAVGSNDFTIFAPMGRTICIEVKARGGKLSNDQLAWAKEMSMLGHTVHTVWSFEEFLDRINNGL